jgi:hypothetical protein
MDVSAGRDPLSFLGRRFPAGFETASISIEPRCRRVYDEAEWRDAIVVVERGEVELECREGSQWRFRRGDVLWLVGLPLRAIHNRGCEPALLVAVSRARTRGSPRVTA